MDGEMVVGTYRADSCGCKGVCRCRRGGIGGRIRQEKRQTHEANRDNTAVNNIGTEPSSLLDSALGK